MLAHCVLDIFSLLFRISRLASRFLLTPAASLPLTPPALSNGFVGLDFARGDVARDPAFPSERGVEARELLFVAIGLFG